MAGSRGQTGKTTGETDRDMYGMRPNAYYHKPAPGRPIFPAVFDLAFYSVGWNFQVHIVLGYLPIHAAYSRQLSGRFNRIFDLITHGNIISSMRSYYTNRVLYYVLRINQNISPSS